MTIPERFAVVVDKMRYTGTFSNVSQNGNIWTVTVDNSLVTGEWISVSGTEYRITEATSDYFKVKSDSFPSSGTYKALAPYFMYGHRLEIAARLTDKENDKKFKYQKYPLIALRLDIPERVNTSFHQINANVAILEFTDEKYDAQERYDNVIIPKLYPLYERFLKALKYGKFQNLGVPEHVKIDRPYWGVEYSEGNSKNIFNDPIDAIEIIDLKLKILN